MWIIGLLLLAAAVVVGIDIVTRNDTQVDLEAFNHTWTSSPAAAFVVGVVTALVGVFGLWFMVFGMKRARVHRRERRAEMAERDRLADERRREIDAMSTANGRDREPVNAGERVAARDDDTTMDRDRDMQDRDMQERDVDLRDDRPATAQDEEAPHRHGVFHRSHN